MLIFINWRIQKSKYHIHYVIHYEEEYSLLEKKKKAVYPDSRKNKFLCYEKVWLYEKLSHVHNIYFWILVTVNKFRIPEEITGF